jgi:hypothetical protein
MLDLVERIIIDTYQYTMMCLLVPAQAIALLAIQLAVRMLGFGHKVREFQEPLDYREREHIRDAKRLFCDSIDDSYLSDMVKTPDVVRFFDQWLDGDVSDFFAALVDHCRHNSTIDDDNGWRKLLARPNGFLAKIREADVQSMMQRTAMMTAALPSDQQPLDVPPEPIGDVQQEQQQQPPPPPPLEQQVSMMANNDDVDADAPEDGEIRVGAPRLSPPGAAFPDVVVSSPPQSTAAADGDAAVRTSSPESSPEEGEVPLTRSLEAIRRSVRSKRRRVGDSK